MSLSVFLCFSQPVIQRRIFIPRAFLNEKEGTFVRVLLFLARDL